MAKANLDEIRLEEKLIKAEKRTLNRMFKWFMKKKDQVLKREAALKERREKIKGKESIMIPSPGPSSPQLTATESKPKRGYRKRG